MSTLISSNTFSGTVESCSGTSECLQRWSSCLNLLNDTCDLDGSYAMSFSKECRDTNNCPLTESDIPTMINFTLTSENFCAEINVDIGLYGSIQSYQDSTFTVLTSSYILGRKACFLVTVNSDSNPSPYSPTTASIILSNTSLITVTVRLDGTNNIIKLFDSGLPTSNNLGTQITEIDMVDGNVVGFCYIFSSQLITNLNCTGSVVIITGASVEVSYGTNSTSKRALSNTGTDQSTFSSSNQIDTDSNTTKNNGFIIFGSLLSILISLLM